MLWTFLATLGIIGLALLISFFLKTYQKNLEQEYLEKN